MSIKTRRFLFYSLVIVFLLVGSFLVLNSRGYTIDWKGFQVEATGGIYVNSNPTKVQITLDGKNIQNETGLLQQGTLIDKLSPGTYTLAINLEGYSAWQKDVEVESGTVTVFDSIILIPETEPVQLSDISNVTVVVAAGKHLATESINGILLDGTEVFGDEIIALSESGTLIAKTATDDFYLANAFDPEENLNVSLVFNNLKAEKLGLVGAVDIKKILPYPYNDRRFVIATNQALYLLDIEKLSIEQIALGVNNFFQQGQNGISWVEEGVLKTFSLPLRSEAVVLALEDIEGIASSLRDAQNTPFGWILLDSTGQLFLIPPGAPAVVLDSDVDEFIVSPNKESIAIFSGDSIFVYNFTDQELLDLGARGSIRDFEWFKDSSHLFILRGEDLIFVDLNSTRLENGVTLAQGVRSFSYSNGGVVTFANGAGIWTKVITD